MAANQSTYLVVAHHFSDLLAGIHDDQWGNPTPCDDWDVRALVTHVIGTHQGVYSMVRSEGIEHFDTDASLSTQWIVTLRAYEEILADEALSSEIVTTRAGEQTFGALVESLLMCDTLSHSWDLARAIGADETLDSTAVATAHAFLEPMSEALRVPGGFKDAIAPPDGADDQTKFLAFAGRCV